MLIIDNKIVIAHMKKCGGTSVCLGMIENLPAESVTYWGYTVEGEEKSAQSRRRGGLWKHSPVADIVEKLPQDREDLTIFVVSARPCMDRTGSFYFHARRHNTRDPQKYPWIKGMTFSDFIRSDHMREVEHLDRFCQDGTGALLVDHVVTYSGISGWYRDLMTRLGVADAALPVHNQGKAAFSEGYRSLYSEEDIAFLAQKFAGETALLERLQPSGDGLLTPT